MKKTIAVFLSLFISVSVHAAEIPSQVPDSFYVTEHWISLTTSYNIDTKTQRLGTLYRRFFSLLLTYDFYDPFENKIAYARSKFFSLTAHFDVYDNNDVFLGAADERLFAFFPTFDVFARDGYTKLATASMNFWGTTFTIYDPITNREMAIMHRPFFRIKNDWTFTVTNRALFDHKGIDPRVLMTVVAFQGDREYWEEQNSSFKTAINSNFSMPIAEDISPDQIKALRDKVDAIIQQEQIDSSKLLDDATVEAVAAEMDSDFRNMLPHDSLQSGEERISAFTDYCLNLIQSSALSVEKKKALLFLLKTRLDEGVA